MLSPSQPHQTRLSELLLHSLYLQELNKSLCAKVFSALKVLTEGKGEKENPQKRKSTELNFPFNPFLLPFGTLPKRSLSKRYKELGLTTGHDGKAKVFRWGNPVHHPLRAETQIPSFAWAGDRVSTEQPHLPPWGGTHPNTPRNKHGDARWLLRNSCEHAHLHTPQTQLKASKHTHMSRLWAWTCLSRDICSLGLASTAC